MRCVFAACLAVASFCHAVSARAGEPRLLPRDPLKQLLLDDRVMASADGARLVLGRVEKDRRNPLFQADKPWENSLNNLYPNVTYDVEDRCFKLWYKCVLADKEVIAKMMPPATIHDVGWFLLYATSKDGVAWEKPELGLHGFDGNRRNNIAARDTANVGAFKDPHETDPARRYKMIYDVGFNQFRVRFSADGIRWSDPVQPEGLVLPGAQNRTGDTHSNAFWDERLGRYVLITRLYRGARLVAQSTSRDFLHWEAPQVVLQATPAEGTARQTYCMPSFPYANVYLGYVMMYNATGDRAVDCELAWSPDAVRWQRVCPGKPLIPRGPEGSVDSKCIYAAAGPAIVHDGKLLLYYGGSNVVHRGWKRHCLPCLARLRVDGFAGYEPAQPGQPGTIVTQPMQTTGQPLAVSADARDGSIRVAVLDVDGYGLDDCVPIRGDVTDATVLWKGDKSLASLGEKTVRLKIEIRDATLYAVRGLKLAAGKTDAAAPGDAGSPR